MTLFCFTAANVVKALWQLMCEAIATHVPQKCCTGTVALDRLLWDKGQLLSDGCSGAVAMG